MIEFYVDGSGYNGKESKWIFYTENKEMMMLSSNKGYICQILQEKKTNNEMEYQSLIECMKYILELYYAKKILKNQLNKIIINMDSQLVYYQLKGTYQVKSENLKELYKRANEYYMECQEILGLELKWVPREENKAGKQIEKMK